MSNVIGNLLSIETTFINDKCLHVKLPAQTAAQPHGRAFRILPEDILNVAVTMIRGNSSPKKYITFVECVK
jgi:hypothetical protein